VTPEKAMTDAVVGQNLWHSRFASSPAGRATALALLSVLRRDGYLLVSEAKLATALRSTYNGGDEGFRLVLMSEDGGVIPSRLPDEFIAAIFAALVAAQEKGT
jgi:hypothetical protein